MTMMKPLVNVSCRSLGSAADAAGCARRLAVSLESWTTFDGGGLEAGPAAVSVPGWTRPLCSRSFLRSVDVFTKTSAAVNHI